MKETELGTRIVEVHNGSSLFTGNAGGGESNLRRYIIENDLLEAIVAMPEKDFYNTGIATYIWVITNRKEERRRGYVQLIDASKICSPLRKNLGEKNCETTEDDRNHILQLLMDFKETPESKIFRNEEFGYWQVPVLRPKRDKEGNIVLKKGKVVMAKNRNEVEQIPLLYPGGIDAFYENEVKPYDAEAEFGEPVIGYELSFTKYFYKPVQLRSLSEIMTDLNVLESETKGLWEEIMKQCVIADAVTRGVNPNVKFKTTNIPWLPEIPEHWEMSKVSSHFRQRNVKVSDKEYPALSVSKMGVTPQLDNVALSNAEGNSRKLVKIGDYAVNSRSDRKGSCGVSQYEGSVSLITIVLEPFDIDRGYVHYLFRSNPWIEEFYRNGRGIVADLWTTNYQMMKGMYLPVPPLSEQRSIVSYITERASKIDLLIEKLNKEIESIKEYKQRLISDVVTGQVKVC